MAHILLRLEETIFSKRSRQLALESIQLNVSEDDAAFLLLTASIHNGCLGGIHAKKKEKEKQFGPAAAKPTAASYGTWRRWPLVRLRLQFLSGLASLGRFPECLLCACWRAFGQQQRGSGLACGPQVSPPCLSRGGQGTGSGRASGGGRRGPSVDKGRLDL